MFQKYFTNENNFCELGLLNKDVLYKTVFTVAPTLSSDKAICGHVVQLAGEREDLFLYFHYTYILTKRLVAWSQRLWNTIDKWRHIRFSLSVYKKLSLYMLTFNR